MIETARSIFRELRQSWKETPGATYSAVMTFLAAFFIGDSALQRKNAQAREDEMRKDNHVLAQEKEAVRERGDAWRDSAMQINNRYLRHLEQDLRDKSDTTDTQ